MRDYNYQEAVKNDVMDYIKNEIDFKDFDNIEELEEKLNDDLFTEDTEMNLVTYSTECGTGIIECQQWNS